jgi:hypothetical protein
MPVGGAGAPAGRSLNGLRRANQVLLGSPSSFGPKTKPSRLLICVPRKRAIATALGAFPPLIRPWWCDYGFLAFVWRSLLFPRIGQVTWELGSGCGQIAVPKSAATVLLGWLALCGASRWARSSR